MIIVFYLWVLSFPIYFFLKKKKKKKKKKEIEMIKYNLKE